MTARLLPAALIVVSLSIGGCNAGSPAPSALPEPGGLDGRTFISTSVTTDGAQRDLLRDTEIRLSFEDGQLSASAGCNQLGGAFEVIDGRLLMGEMYTTEMGCDPARHAQDEWLVQFLGERPAVTVDDTTLVLQGGATRLELLDRRLARPDRDLVGPAWVLDTIIDGQAASSVPAGVRASLRFTADGRVDVETGCNSGSAQYSIDEGRLSLAPIGLTRIACPGVEGDVEGLLLEVLGAEALPYAIEADSLTVSGGGGLALVLRATD